MDLEPGYTWIEVALAMVPGMTPVERDLVLPGLLKHHQRVAFRMSTHLSLTSLNITGSHWLSAQMLSKCPEGARTGARLFHAKLIRLNPGTATAYEKEWLQDETKMGQLAAFADMEPACLLWRNRGAFKDMFIYLADRFLGSPDSVLDAERVHAKWKWVEHVRRSVAFNSLNATLRLNDYMDNHGDLPPNDGLRPHLETLREGLRAQYQAIRDAGEIAPGLRAR